MTEHNDIQGSLLAGDLKIAIIVSRFNEFITDRLIEGATTTFQQLGGNPKNLTVAHVPGAFELPVAALKAAKSGNYDAIICLGAVIRGATTHYDYVCGQAASGIANVSATTGVPAIFGVITTDTIEQAIERAGSKQGNQGAKAIMTAIETANLLNQL